MKKINDIKAAICAPAADSVFTNLYGESIHSRKRYLDLIDWFSAEFPEKEEIAIFSTPGRTEIGGNHTDHNAGHILASAVDLDVVSVVAQQDRAITIYSEGYGLFTVSLNDLEAHPEEVGTSVALVRGVCARFLELGYHIGGFCAVTTSNVLRGSGLSSSAAFEVQIANILNVLYNSGNVDPVTQAMIAQYAENDYFGKPCGLMDMSTCAVGGLLKIDFKDFEDPIFEQIDYDFSACGYAMVIVDTGGNHADMTDDYIALEHEMKEVARTFGKSVLRECTREQIFSHIAELRGKVSDRAILRAIHFYDDDERVLQQVEALHSNDIDRFLQLIIESGRSSWELCQNCYSHKYPESQGISIALEIARHVLSGRGAYRVHGGGFAGTIQTFVPLDMVESFTAEMTSVFGSSAVFRSTLGQEGAIEVKF